MYESRIVFTLDTVCPWTYLAKRRLDKAIEEVRKDSDVSSQAQFTVVFEPYQLNPDLASGDGVDKYAWYRDTKYDGSDERMRKFIILMDSYGAPLDIHFKFGGTLANTLDAHRVLQHFQEEKGPAAANALVDALYKLYFEQEQNPSSDDTLLRACADAGIDQAEAESVVRDKSERLIETKQDLKLKAMNGVDSVPHIMIEGRKRDLTLIGAKEVPEYVKALQTIAKESK